MAVAMPLVGSLVGCLGPTYKVSQLHEHVAERLIYRIVGLALGWLTQGANSDLILLGLQGYQALTAASR